MQQIPQNSPQKTVQKIHKRTTIYIFTKKQAEILSISNPVKILLFTISYIFPENFMI